jgi:predicted PurR-regulated permease PerM
MMAGAGDQAPSVGAGGAPRQRRDLHIPLGTILKVVASGLGLWAALLLWPGFLLFLTALLLAVTLHPSVLWMERRGVGRGASVLVIAVLTVGLLAVFVAFLLPPLTAQMTSLVREFPEFRARILSRIPTRYPAVQDVIRELFESPSSPSLSSLLERSFIWGQSAVVALVLTVIVLVLTLYLLVDGVSLYAWLLAFIPRTHREKLAATASEVSQVVHAFVGGQFLAALLFAVFTGVLLVILRVPAAAPLAVLAGLCNVIPVLGILLATLPAALLALAVSPGTAAVVVAAYLGYHLFETYFLLPRIYGNKLKISTLSVLLALLVGGRLQGIIGAVLVLPLVAAYPIIERHWLSGYLRSRVLTDHKALAKAAETGSEAAIDAVLHGEKHASEDASAQTQRFLTTKKTP